MCVGLGFLGVFVPGIPTTPLILLAAWFFSRSSKHLEKWLINHKRFGPILRNWESHKVVPKNAKRIMVIMQISAVVIIQYTLNNVFITISLAVLLIFVAWYVIRLPSEVYNEL